MDGSTRPLVPPVRLDMITIRNGWFVIGDGLDGLVLTEDGRAIRETAMFTRLADRSATQVPFRPPPFQTAFDDVFIGFDGSWGNWYHWLCFALGRSALAAKVLGGSTQIVLPEYIAGQQYAFSAASWRQSLEAFGIAGRTHCLPPGLYRAGRVRLLWTNPSEPTDLTHLDVFHEAFGQVRRGLRPKPDAPRRLLITRARSANPRIDAADSALVERVAIRRGFAPLHLEEIDFRGQADALFNAECIIGVHGAGMANILFGREALRVLELNLRLDGEPVLRPWFYLLAHARRQRYMMLDRDVGDLSEDRLQSAIDALCNAHTDRPW